MCELLNLITTAISLLILGGGGLMGVRDCSALTLEGRKSYLVTVVTGRATRQLDVAEEEANGELCLARRSEWRGDGVGEVDVCSDRAQSSMRIATSQLGLAAHK